MPSPFVSLLACPCPCAACVCVEGSLSEKASSCPALTPALAPACRARSGAQASGRPTLPPREGGCLGQAAPEATAERWGSRFLAVPCGAGHLPVRLLLWRDTGEAAPGPFLGQGPHLRSGWKRRGGGARPRETPCGHWASLPGRQVPGLLPGVPHSLGSLPFATKHFHLLLADIHVKYNKNELLQN